MGCFFFLILASMASLSIQSDFSLQMNSLSEGIVSLGSSTEQCFILLTTETVDRIQELKKDLKRGKFEILVVHLHILTNQTRNMSDIVWTMSKPEGISHTAEDHFVMTSYLQKSTKVEYIQANMSCLHMPVVDLNRTAGFASDIGDIFEILGGLDSGEHSCNETGNCTETCGKAVDEPLLINLTYLWIVIILLYSPNLVYVLYDALHIDKDHLTHYHTKDCPYSLKRFLLHVSYYMVICCPFFKKYVKGRPVIRTILILWVVGMLFQTLHVCLQMSDLSSKFAYKELDEWMYRSLTKEARYRIYGASVIIGIIITILLLQLMPTDTYKTLLDDPFIFIASSTGTSRNFFVKKSKLKLFLKHEERKQLKDGQTMVAMHAERFMLILNHRFWLFVLKESFSGLLFRTKLTCVNCAVFLPVFVMCLLFFALNIATNILWGVYPLFGLFLSCLTLVDSWSELFRICFLAVYFGFFVMIIFGNNLVFGFNITIYTTMYTLPCSSFDDLTKYFMVFPILLYFCFYWRKFICSYKTMLDFMFKLKADLNTDKESNAERDNHERRSSHGNLTKPEVTNTISIEEFDFVCGECSPVRKKVLNLLIKIMMTGIFMLLTLTILFLRKEIDSFSKAAKTVAFIVIILLPRIIEKLWTGDEAATQNELEDKISKAVCRWWTDKGLKRRDFCDIKVDNVNCTWWKFCADRKNVSENKHNKEQKYTLKECSVTMLNEGVGGQDT